MRLALFATCLALSLAACGPTTYLVEGRHKAVPFEGELRVEQHEDRRRFELEVSGVPEPWRLSPEARVYVAWIVSSRRGPARLSRVDFDDLARKAHFDEPSSEEGDRVKVTAEAEPWVGEPGAAVLFERDIDQWTPPRK